MNLYSNVGKVKTDRVTMLKMVSEFNEKLYGMDKEKRESLMRRRKGEGEEVKEEIPEIMIWKVGEIVEFFQVPESV